MKHKKLIHLVEQKKKSYLIQSVQSKPQQNFGDFSASDYSKSKQELKNGDSLDYFKDSHYFISLSVY